MSLHINKGAVLSSHPQTDGCWCLYSFLWLQNHQICLCWCSLFLW